MTATLRPILEIDLAAIAANYRRLQHEAGGANVAGVVKADGYGLGAVPVVQTLLDAGCTLFFVARVEEGITLRSHFPSITIAVFDGITPGDAAIFAEQNLVPVLNQRAELQEWQAVARRLDRPLPAMLHNETGINRLGLSSAEFAALEVDDLVGIDVIAVMSHLACADDRNHPMNDRQLKRFLQQKELFPKLKFSLANSSGIFLGEAYHFDICRPGIALYGGNPTMSAVNPMKPVVRLTAPVLQVRKLDEDGLVGYGATYGVYKGGRIAIIPVGYADGLIRASSERGMACFNGHMLGFAGRVSMDMVTLDASFLPPSMPMERGDWVELLGPAIGIDDLAAAAGTVGYEILTSLSHRYERRYIHAETAA